MHAMVMSYVHAMVMRTWIAMCMRWLRAWDSYVHAVVMRTWDSDGIAAIWMSAIIQLTTPKKHV